MDGDEDVLEMTREELREWIKEKVTETLNPGTSQSSRSQPLIERRERRLTVFRRLCDSVAECEATMKEAYSVLGLEYRDTDSEDETHCTNSDHGAAANVSDDAYDSDMHSISFFRHKLPLEKVCHAPSPLSPLQQCSSEEDEVVEEWTLRLSGRRSAFPKTRVYSCSKCPYTCTSQVFLHKHTRTHDDLDYQMLSTGRITSAACQKPIGSVASQKQGHTDEKAQPGEVGKPFTGKKTHLCNQCQKRFTSSSTLRRHLHVHTGEKNFTCDQCGKRFSRSDNLKSHLSLHTGVQPFSCNHCDRRFSRPRELKSHLHVHTVRAFPCNHCVKSFNYSSKLRSHLLVHSGVKAFPCNHCDRRFSRPNDLKSHLRVHTVRAFPCNHCGKSFNYSSKLKSHLLVHSRVKAFPCNHCDKRFSCPHELKSHLLVHTGVRPFPCNHCDMRFSHSSNLKRHLRVHSGVKPFSCKQCGKSFSCSSHTCLSTL